MKSLQNILCESILDKGGPVMLDENSAWAIYKALDKLPKANYAGYMRYYWADADKNANKFWRTIKQNINLNDGIMCKISEAFDQSGFVVPYPLPPSLDLNAVAAWDRSNDEFILISTGKFQVGIFNQEKIKRAGFETTFANPSFFDSFYILQSDDIDDWKVHIADGFNGNTVIFFPCSIDMNLIKKILDSKTRGILRE